AARLGRCGTARNTRSFRTSSARHNVAGSPAQAGTVMMIRESIITTVSRSGAVHIAPMGVIWEGAVPVLAPFRPSQTLENLIERPFVVVNHTDDVRVFAGCLTGRRDWPVRAADRVEGVVLENALSHQELVVSGCDDDPVRPRFRCRIVHERAH